MSAYPDYGASENDVGFEGRGRRPNDADPHLPAPPLGPSLKPALKRQGSRNRLQPEDRPQFPDEASYLGGRAPDAEVKNGPRERSFRDQRDGYESEEGEKHKSSKYTPRNRMPRSNDEDLAYDDRKRRPRRNEVPPPDSAISGATRGGYDDPPPRRRRDRDDRRDYDDEAPPPRRRGDRPPPVEYGAEPVPTRQKSERRPRPRRDYSEYSDDDDYRPRRRRGASADGYGRRPRDYDDRPYYSDRRRDDDYDRAPARRRDSSRRRRDDYDDYDRYDDRYDDRDRDSRRDRDRDRDSRQAKEIKIGKYDIGPWIEQGKKHWTTVAPILTPIVLAQIRKMGGGGSGGGGGRR